MSGLPVGWWWTVLEDICDESRARVRPNSIEKTTYVGLEHVERGTNGISGGGNSDDVKSTVAVFSAGDVL